MFDLDSYTTMSRVEESQFIETMCLALLGNFAIAAILLLSGVKAPYGRYVSNQWWAGCMMNGKFAWIVQEAPNLVMIAYFYYFTKGDSAAKASLPNRILLGCFAWHYVYRTCIFPLRIRGGKDTAFITFIMAFAFCACNGYLQGRTLTYIRVYPEEWLATPQFRAGVLVWALGWFSNFYHDSILINLRKPGETGYKIPKGGLFKYISGANFFSEIMEWTGFAIACWNVPAACFAMTTALNIGPRAIQHHNWYKEKFKGEYPPERKALIPFVY
jgi:3-oxo-5-alpha-steroid 4-dehydrogenase 1|eukprot:g8275.t1